MAPDGPKMALDGPRWPQDGPKMAPRWPQEAPRWPQKAPRCPKTAPRWPQDGPKKAQEGPKMAQDGTAGRNVRPRLSRTIRSWDTLWRCLCIHNTTGRGLGFRVEFCSSRQQHSGNEPQDAPQDVQRHSNMCKLIFTERASRSPTIRFMLEAILYRKT